MPLPDLGHVDRLDNPAHEAIVTDMSKQPYPREGGKVMSTKGELIVLAAFVKDKDGELVPAFDPRQMESENRAKCDAQLMADQFAGVIAWSREAEPSMASMAHHHHFPEW